MAKEIWKPAEGFAGYEVSNLGNIRDANGIINQNSNGRGYRTLVRKICGTKKRAYVHRLVAKAFIPNPYSKPCVNHKDCNPSNNRADNLEWCTHKENMAYMNKLGRNKRTGEWIEHLYESFENNGILRPVTGISVKSGDMIFCDYLNETKKWGFNPSCVWRCCNGKQNQHKGYRWRYG